jgi:hypothetical protein
MMNKLWVVISSMGPLSTFVCFLSKPGSGGMAQVVEFQSSKCKALSSNTSNVNGKGEVSAQISKFFVSHMEESTAGDVGVNGVY